MGVDSSQYIFACELGSREDAPADFDPNNSLPDFQEGLFLPRADPDWLGRSAYPPRVLALLPAGLLIAPHPAAKAATQLVRFDRLCFVEVGRILLHGWIRVVGNGTDRTLLYNTRYRGAVDSFLWKLRARFLEGSDVCQTEAARLGPPLNLKFEYALARELGAAESIRMSLFRPPQGFVRRAFGFKRAGTVPADLVVLTNSRLLWITDRNGGIHARYGSIVRYAPLSKVASLARVSDARQHSLSVSLGAPDVEWRIPVSPEQWQDAAQLENAFGRRRQSGVSALERGA